jgi:hypothetical protein
MHTVGGWARDEFTPHRLDSLGQHMVRGVEPASPNGRVNAAL